MVEECVAGKVFQIKMMKELLIIIVIFLSGSGFLYESQDHLRTSKHEHTTVHTSL